MTLLIQLTYFISPFKKVSLEKCLEGTVILIPQKIRKIFYYIFKGYFISQIFILMLSIRKLTGYNHFNSVTKEQYEDEMTQVMKTLNRFPNITI